MDKYKIYLFIVKSNNEIGFIYDHSINTGQMLILHWWNWGDAHFTLEELERCSFYIGGTGELSINPRGLGDI